MRPACASSGSTRSGDWSVWLKKQTGVGGFRLDAAKHFESWATQDFLWNLAYNAGFASGGSQMYAVGEVVGSASQMDAWVDAVEASISLGVRAMACRLNGDSKNFDKAAANLARTAPSDVSGERLRATGFGGKLEVVWLFR